MPDRITEPKLPESRRRSRSTRTTGAIPQRPFGQVPRLYDPIRVISEDQVAAIHAAALQVLAETGTRVLHRPARDLFRAAGAEIWDDMVRLDPAMVMDRSPRIY